MKQLLSGLILLVLVNSTLVAQQQQGIVKRDTINLHGYIYDVLGKPVKFILVQSTQKDIDKGINIATRSDTLGFFELKGIKFADTLTFERQILYSPVPVCNQGSRYIVVYLPLATVNNISLAKTVVVTAKREHPKITPQLQISKDPVSLGVFADLHQKAVFPGGYQHFMELLKQQMIYPKKAIANNIEGTVQILFVVERDGSMADFKILKGIGYGCEQQLENTIKRLGHWSPAIENGRLIATQQTVAVEFKLTEK